MKIFWSLFITIVIALSLFFLVLVVQYQAREIKKLEWSVDTQYRVYKKQHQLIKELKKSCGIPI